MDLDFLFWIDKVTAEEETIPECSVCRWKLRRSKKSIETKGLCLSSILLVWKSEEFFVGSDRTQRQSNKQQQQQRDQQQQTHIRNQKDLRRPNPKVVPIPGWKVGTQENEPSIAGPAAGWCGGRVGDVGVF